MPFRLEELISVYPFVYHLTARGNLNRIKQTGRLENAAALMEQADRLDLLQIRRERLTEIEIDGSTIILRDQAPLYVGHIRFEEGWSLPQLIESLNRRVFFWPGKESGPIAYGIRHFNRYAAENPAIIRIQLRDLLESNRGRLPVFCGYNSGSPRTNGGIKSPRGPRSFQLCEEFSRNHRQVVEVTFVEAVVLPTTTEVRLGVDGNWRTLETLGADATMT